MSARSPTRPIEGFFLAVSSPAAELWRQAASMPSWWLMSLVLLLALLLGSVRGDSARLMGSSIVVDPLGIRIELPRAWIDTSAVASSSSRYDREVRGPLARRLAVSRPFLDSVRNAEGEWDHEYSAVADSLLPFANLVAHLGPEPFGRGATSFGDLQMRVYIGARSRQGATGAAGLRAAQAFFPSARLAGRDSAQWHIERIYWNAWYGDYGGEANVEMYSTTVRHRVLTLVFMHATIRPGWAEEDQRFILEHLRLR